MSLFGGIALPSTDSMIMPGLIVDVDADRADRP